MFNTLIAYWSSKLSKVRRHEHSIQRLARMATGQPHGVESLEERMLLNCDCTLNNEGVLVIEGRNVRDAVFLVVDTRGTVDGFDDQIKLDITHSGHTDTVRFFKRDVFNIIFHGNDGDDEFNNLTPIPSEAWGGAGNDTLRGGDGQDVLYGDSGDDSLSGYSGHDELYGGSGTDSLFGGRGNDRLDGGNDRRVDQMTGGTGADTFVQHQWSSGFPFYWKSHMDDDIRDFNSLEDEKVWICH